MNSVLSEKGQVTIPKRLREELGLVPGTVLNFSEENGRLVARRIVPFVKPGDIVAAGQRIGLIRFGSRVDVYLPKGTSVQVLVGQRVIAGETVLARLDQNVVIEGVQQ